MYSAKTFDLAVKTRSDQNYLFRSISKKEYNSVFGFLKDRIKIEGLSSGSTRMSQDQELPPELDMEEEEESDDEDFKEESEEDDDDDSDESDEDDDDSDEDEDEDESDDSDEDDAPKKKKSKK